MFFCTPANVIGCVTVRYVALFFAIFAFCCFPGLLPWYTADAGIPPGADVEAIVGDVFRSKVRIIGAGTIGVAAIWTLLKIIGPIVRGLKGALAANRSRGAGEVLPLTERDLPITIVGGTILASMVPITLLLAGFADSGPIADAGPATIGFSLLYILGAGLVIASVCGYMAGLIGASNSPISGVGILSVLGISLILVALFGSGADDPQATRSLVAFALFVTALVFGIATISNDNLQDLKAGYIVGATPWRQQVMLAIGSVSCALIMAPVLNMLADSYGIGPATAERPNSLEAPQANLMASIAKGIFGGELPWDMIGIGALIGVAVIVLDQILKVRNAPFRVPVLAAAIGIYLPLETMVPIFLGGLLNYLVTRRFGRGMW